MNLDDYHGVLSKISGTTILSLDELMETQPHLSTESVQLGQSPDYTGNPARSLEQTEIQHIIAQAIEELPEREKHVIALYYQEELTLREIGEVLGVTESRICQIHSQAISRLHGRLASQLS